MILGIEGHSKLIISSDLINVVCIKFQAIKKIPSRNNGSNIRSVSFKGNILTIGNGGGVILFWDLRAGKFLDSTMNTNRAVTLKASRGWVVRILFRFIQVITISAPSALGVVRFSA